MPTDDRPARPLSLFESKPVVETTVKCAGTITHVYDKPPRELRHGEVIVAVTIMRVSKVGFSGEEDDLVREHTLQVQQVYELDLPQLDARKLLAELRAKTRRDVEARYVEEPVDAESGAA